jgi:hypothetical protein
MRLIFFIKHHIESVKVAQEKLLGHFFDKVSKKCNQRPLNSEIDCQGIANVISSLTRLKNKWPEIGKTQKFNDAMIALLFHVKKRACRFPHQVGVFLGSALVFLFF